MAEQDERSNPDRLAGMQERADRLGHHFESVSSQPASPRTATAARGQPLPTALAQKMGRAFEHDFSDVRVHESPEPATMDAIAFTRGSEIHFAPGQYEPTSSEGQRVLGHELAHVVQQRQGRVSPIHRLGGYASNLQSHLELEADSAGTRAALGQATSLGSSGAAASTPASPSPVQAVLQPLRDKLAFEKGSAEDFGEEHHTVASLIDSHVKGQKEALRTQKRQRVEGWEQQLRTIATSGGTEQDRNRDVKKSHQDFLDDYHKIGWNKAELQEGIKQKLGEHGHEVSVEGNEFKYKGKTVYRIAEGDERFKHAIPKGEGLEQDVYKKLGTNKHYVKDARGTFVPRYARRAITQNERTSITQDEPPEALLPRDPSTTLGTRAEQFFDVGNDTHDSELTNEQLEFLQNRDGTYLQRLLSATHTKHKIFGNHGVSFDANAVPDEGLKYGGSVFIDMAKIGSEHILNQHLAESRTKKTQAFPGWGKRNKNSLKGLIERKFKAKPADDQDRKLVDNWDKAREDLQGASELPDKKRKPFVSAEKKAQSAFDTRYKQLLGKSAEPGAPTTPQDETKEADASAVRNRETHFKKIPLSAIAKRIEPDDASGVSVEDQFAQFLQEQQEE